MYIPFNVKTNYCMLSSLNDVSNLINEAKKLNIRTIGITDSDMYSTMDFYKECLKNDIKPIIGLELKINDRGILLYAMNYEGYQNLTRLVYLKQESNLTLDILESHNDNLICIMPYAAHEIYDDLRLIYKHLYVGYSNLDERVYLRKKSDKTVFINEVLYIHQDEQIYLKYLYLIRDAKKVNDIDEYQLEDNHHLMDYDEIKELCPDEDIKRMEEISNLCNISFSSNPHLLPKYNNDPSFDAKIYLQSLCKVGLSKRMNNKVLSTYVNRLKYELDIIDKMGFNNYFLVVYDFIKYAKTNDILVGPGRGSSSSSLVSYCLGITDVDPLEYNLFFERFLNLERITMPDIDIDFESTSRGEVVDYVINKYGKKRAMPIITFVTLGGKQAIRDVARIFDVTSSKIDTICKMVDIRLSLMDNLKNNNHLMRLLNTDDSLLQVYKVASFIEGCKRQISTHAAGVVISELELDSYIPLQKYDNYYITGFSMEHLEELGLLKMDFLGLRNLTLIERVLNDIKSKTGKTLLFKNIPINDLQTLELFAKAMTEGIFQFESPGMKNFIRKLKPNTLEDVIAATALFRPGPMKNIDSFIRRKEGREKIDYLHNDLYDILKPTYGIIIYQEQIMQIASVMAGYSLGEADILRRAMSKKKKDVLEKEETKFIEKSVAKGYDEVLATKVYHLILRFADYGFPRAHAVAYAIIAIKMAYLKVHYAPYFMSSLLTNVIGNEHKTKEYIDECRICGIGILKPDINISEYAYKVEDEGIRFSLAAIRNVGSIACKEIIKERSISSFSDFFDFVSRIYGKAVTKKTIEALIDADVFKSFGYNHQTLLYNIDNAISYAELTHNVDSSLVEKPMMAETLEMPKEELSQREVSVFGFYLSNHPTLEHKALYENITNISDVVHYFDQIVDVIVLVDRIKVINTKTNDQMAFITVNDESGKIDLVLFPNIYKEYFNIDEGVILKVKARVEKRMSRYQLSVVKVEILTDL